ncbi:MBL fold metallo-hydrolase [Spirillospora sp. NPDC048819]|uniref:MBL fold metallo-hydrolase n=1 Tax=Spirillospora sp. NPDC048819 TaxID=3155268 RepID=UPI0033D55D9C
MQPTLGEPFSAVPDVHVIPTYWPVPGAGVLPMNAFLLHAEEPVLVDTGAGVLAGEFLAALESLIDIADLRWIWLTHEDRDHTGSLGRLLELAPQATVISSFLSVGRIMPEHPFPLDRLRVVNPGDKVHVGDRTLETIRPPLFDSPGTTGFIDGLSGALFSSDCFGAPLPDLDEAAAASVSDLPFETVAAGQLAWATVDSPWVSTADPARLGAALESVVRLRPSAVLSSHLPPVHERVEEMAGRLRAAPDADPVPPTTHDQLTALLATMEPAS